MTADVALSTAIDALERTAEEKALDDALRALRDNPQDPHALRVAVAAAADSGSEHALTLAERLAVADPSGPSMRMLGLVRLSEGHTDGAERALSAALRLTPHDAAAALALGHLYLQAGRTRDAVRLIEQAQAAQPEDPGIVFNLLELHRDARRLRKAITWAERLVELAPEDPIVRLDLAELSMELNEHEEAAEHFRQLGLLDDGPGRRIYSLHGMIEAHLRGGQLRAALDLAITASKIDREELTTDVMAFLVAEVFGQGRTSIVIREQLLAGFAAERARYRRVLADTGVL